MTITTTKLTRAAGLSAVAAGLLFVVIQFIHPHESLEAVTTTRWLVTHVLGVAMAVLALTGLTGLYLRQVKETGVLGLVGFLLFGACWFVILPFQFFEAFVAPPLADQAPQFVHGTLAISTGDTVVGDVGSLQAINTANFPLYLLGGVLFGIALYRARIVARWAAVLLAFGTVLTVLIPVLPHSLARMTAVPVGLGLAGLGYSLWREQRTRTHAFVPSLRDARLDPAGAE